MKNRTLLLTLVVVILISCGGGGGGSGSTANQSMGGIWEGTDSDGNDILGITTEDGRFHFIDDAGLGFGKLFISGDRVNSNYTYVSYLGTALSDGSTIEACTLFGTITEKQSLSLTSECITFLDSESEATVSLRYNPLYDSEASLATIAGVYDEQGNVLNIDSTGTLFEQDATNGCVRNGEVSVIDPSNNAYRINYLVEDCNVGFEDLNGTTWSGIAILDNTVTPEELVIGVVGDVTVSGDTETLAIVMRMPRI